jgi:hypothetical protein
VVRLLVGVVIVAALLSLAACGDSGKPSDNPARPTTGIFGITVGYPGGLTTPTPSPLPRGFGLSILRPARHEQVVVCEWVNGKPGDVVARIESRSGGIFWVPLPAGTYALWGGNVGRRGRRVVDVHSGAFTRVVLRTAEYW